MNLYKNVFNNINYTVRKSNYNEYTALIKYNSLINLVKLSLKTILAKNWNYGVVICLINQELITQN